MARCPKPVRVKSSLEIPILNFLFLLYLLMIELVQFQNQLLLTLNFRGENYAKGLPEDAEVKSSEGVYALWRLF